jgi:hypothetical protein
MDMKEPWLEYITKVADLGPLEEAFAKFRTALKDAGFKEDDLLAVSEAPREVFARRFQVVRRIDDLRNELKKYALWNEFNVKRNFDSYIARKLSKLEEKYPL